MHTNAELVRVRTKWLVGSSSKRMCGLCIDKTANETRDFCPPERVPINCSEVMPCGRLDSRVSDRAPVCLQVAVRRWGGCRLRSGRRQRHKSSTHRDTECTEMLTVLLLGQTGEQLLQVRDRVDGQVERVDVVLRKVCA